MFSVGDVVHFNSPTTGKPKYHICIGLDENGGPRLAFLFVNSDDGFEGCCVFDDGDIPGLPRSRTGKSVVSFTNITRMGQDKLRLFNAQKVGVISSDIAGVLAGFAQNTKVLNRKERLCVVQAMESIF